jgi:tRNA(Ile)-lysidine synthase
MKFDLPLTTHILIAYSGGPDSTALAHLLLKYGRRIAAPENIELLHVNHGWRGAESDGDEEFAKNFALEMGASCHSFKVAAPDGQSQSYGGGRSWDEVARSLRKDIFNREAESRSSWILTAHQMDDLAETVLWRLLTGAAESHGGGIARKHGVELRPLLNIRKKELLAYLQEERQGFRVDQTNDEERFLRARMRKRLFPEIEEIFPRAVENLAQLGFNAQTQDDEHFTPEKLIGSSGLSDRN